MGPRARARGIRFEAGRSLNLRFASMGPRARARGIEEGFRKTLEYGKASMGPRARARGIHAGEDQVVDARACFNRATRSRAWNPPLLTADQAQTVLLQWGHALARVESPHHARDHRDAR